MALILLAAGLCGCAQPRWYPDYAQAQPVARRENRPMLLYFWDWLTPETARLDMQVFRDPAVTAAMRRTVNVRLENTWFRDLSRQYDVRQTPTFILADPEGVEQTRLTGVPAPRDFAAWLDQYLQRRSATRPAATQTAPALPAATQPSR